MKQSKNNSVIYITWFNHNLNHMVKYFKTFFGSKLEGEIDSNRGELPHLTHGGGIHGITVRPDLNSISERGTIYSFDRTTTTFLFIKTNKNYN